MAAVFCLSVSAAADNTSSRAVIGADLTSEQTMLMYQAFGVPQGSVIELRLTNAEERQYLEGYVASSVIGTRSISCVYVELLAQGSGMNVTTSNITWCTGDMYSNALATAGITDARIIVAAPFPVSGTAALAGVYKAYEDITGQALNSQAKDAGTQELTVTGELAKDIGSSDSSSIVQELKLMLSETQKMSDALPGRKIILKGNHDYWWNTVTKIKKFFADNGIRTVDILYNNFFEYGEYAICGTRGWFYEEEKGGEHDRKIMMREVMRLEASLKAAGERKKLVFLHYPPKYQFYTCPEIVELFKKYEVRLCCYGHIHGKGCRYALNGWSGGTEYRLVSADNVMFAPVRLPY